MIIYKFHSKACKLCPEASQVLDTFVKQSEEKIELIPVDILNNEFDDLVDSFAIQKVPTIVTIENGHTTKIQGLGAIKKHVEQFKAKTEVRVFTMDEDF